MSRVVQCPVYVVCNDWGEPIALTLSARGRSLPVLSRLSHWREWVGALDGEPERDVWLIELTVGVCEVHCLRQPTQKATSDHWILHRWED